MKLGETLEKLINSSLSMKGEFDEMKKQLKDKAVVGSSGGGMVKVHVNGALEIINIEFEQDVLEGGDRVMLVELIKSATNKAREASSSVKPAVVARVRSSGAAL